MMTSAPASVVAFVHVFVVGDGVVDDDNNAAL